jgi:hypothetical protein
MIIYLPFLFNLFLVSESNYLFNENVCMIKKNSFKFEMKIRRIYNNTAVFDLHNLFP